MMLRDEQILTFSEAAKTLPRVNGRRPHASTLWRWARKGIQGIHLETRRLGGRFVTSLEALDRFSERLAEANPLETKADIPRRSQPRHRARDIEAAEQRLAKAGI